METKTALEHDLGHPPTDDHEHDDEWVDVHHVVKLTGHLTVGDMSERAPVAEVKHYHHPTLPGSWPG